MKKTALEISNEIGVHGGGLNLNYEDDYLPVIEDEINQPIHYHKGGIDVIGFLEQHYGNKQYTIAEGFAIGCIHKYVARYKEKGGMKDLKKAEFYVKKLMEYEDEKA